MPGHARVDVWQLEPKRLVRRYLYSLEKWGLNLVASEPAGPIQPAALDDLYPPHPDPLEKKRPSPKSRPAECEPVRGEFDDAMSEASAVAPSGAVRVHLYASGVLRVERIDPTRCARP